MSFVAYFFGTQVYIGTGDRCTFLSVTY